jgi:hypothetical protein
MLMVGLETATAYPAELQLENPFGNFTVPVTQPAFPRAYILALTAKATQLHSVSPLPNSVDHTELLSSSSVLIA